MNCIIGNSGTWEYVIGLEVHAQISSKSKLFSGSKAEFGNPPNSSVSLVDAAMPGMLPMLNEYCVHQAIKTGLSLNATINLCSIFDRKNYFYPDLPAGYQISQFYHPIVSNGYINITLLTGIVKTIRINRLHLEQDAGKSIHDQSLDYSFVDLNRAGIGLMEIVTEPDISSSFEACEYIKKLRSILRYIGACDCDMENGSMRCDANVSVRKFGEPLGTRCEIKNLNSIRNIGKAIEFEAMRQVKLIEAGGTIRQETRLFNSDNGETKTMRLKEESHDYRYFPDPDLLPIIISENLIDDIRKTLPELPDIKIARYVKEFTLSQYDAEVIAADNFVAMYFEETILTANAKIVANWIIGELFAHLNKHSLSLKECKIKPSMLAELIECIENGSISSKIAKNVFEIMFTSGQGAQEVILEHNLIQLSDSALLLAVIDEVLTINAESVVAYQSGKEKLFGYFVGQVMRKTDGKANPLLVNDLLKEKLSIKL
jgi:aspartyl-tRNA(Asn)/glutamyl-tRNA(Gln) amidotransferase subunit B